MVATLGEMFLKQRPGRTTPAASFSCSGPQEIRHIDIWQLALDNGSAQMPNRAGLPGVDFFLLQGEECCFRVTFRVRELIPSLNSVHGRADSCEWDR